MSVSARLRRLFAADGHCLDVAIDHGLFNEGLFLTGIEDMQQVVTTLAAAGPDAIQLSPGLADHLQQIGDKTRPALVLRTDVANVYGTRLPELLFSHVMEGIVEQAVRLDAACVVVNLLLLPGQPELHRQCIDNISRLKPACERFGMPLMIEPLAMRANDHAGGYMTDGDLSRIVPLVRQAVELGADIVKADPCDDVENYHRVIEVAAGKPVLVRGGGRVSDVDILRRTYELMQQGAAGIVYGRNVIQHEHPAGMIRALMALVHDDSEPEAASRLLR